MRKVVVCSVALIAIMMSEARPHGKATGIVRERMDQMVTLKDAMKTLKSELSQGESYDAETVVAAADEIERHSGNALTEKFPDGSTQHSEALPTVWSEFERFSELAEKMGLQARTLSASVEAKVPNVTARNWWFGSEETEKASLPAPIDALTSIADTCRACHNDYRSD